MISVKFQKLIMHSFYSSIPQILGEPSVARLRNGECGALLNDEHINIVNISNFSSLSIDFAKYHISANNTVIALRDQTDCFKLRSAK